MQAYQDLKLFVVSENNLFMQETVKSLKALGIENIYQADDSIHAMSLLYAGENPKTMDITICDINKDDECANFFHLLAGDYRSEAIIMTSDSGNRESHSAMGIAESYDMKLIGYVPKTGLSSTLHALIKSFVEDYAEISAKMRRLGIQVHEIENALLQGKVHVRWSPIVTFDDSELAGVAAQSCYNHPEAGLLYQDELMSLIRNTHLELVMFNNLLEDAVAACADWYRKGFLVPMKIRLSPYLLLNANIGYKLSNLLKFSGLPSNLISLIIDEQAVHASNTQLYEVLARLKARGFTLALDGFGAGEPVFSLIDKGLFDHIGVRLSEDESIQQNSMRYEQIKKVQQIARAHNLLCSANNVNSLENWHSLKEIGFDVASGDFVSRPMLEMEMTELCAKRQESPFIDWKYDGALLTC